MTVSIGMTKSRQTLTKAQMAKAQKEPKLAKDAKKNEWKTEGGGKAPRKQLVAKQARKTGKGARVKKPRGNWALLALHKIHHYQKSVDLLIPLLPFQRLIREITQDFKVNLCFQSGVILTIQETVEAFLM